MFDLFCSQVVFCFCLFHVFKRINWSMLKTNKEWPNQLDLLSENWLCLVSFFFFFFYFFFTFNHRMEVCSARLVKQFTALNMVISLKMVLWMSLTRKEAFQAMLTVEWSQLYMTSAVEYRYYYYYYLFFIIIILPLLICDCLFIWSFLVTVCINLLIP